MGPLILREHQWRVRFDILIEGVTHSPSKLRELSGAPTTTPDDLLIAAAAMSAATTAAFLDIMDGGCFFAAPCLCCYSVRSPEHMREASGALRLFRSYHNSAIFVTLRAYGRAVATLSRDLRPEEVKPLQKKLSRLGSVPDAIREIHRLEHGICIATPACRPNTLWVYSTPDGRRLLRHIARSLGDANVGALSVTVASSSGDACPRYRYRMYAATLCARSGDDVAGTVAVLLAITLSWAKARRVRGGPHP